MKMIGATVDEAVADWQSRQNSEPLGFLVGQVNGGDLVMPIFDQLYVGRECLGIAEHRRLLIADKAISRNHLEIRLDVAADQAFAIDTSTNGTWLNGVRLERAIPVRIQTLDRIRIGQHELTFQTDRFTTVRQIDPNLTYTEISEAAMLMVVGDITGYSTISEATDHKLIAQGLQTLWERLAQVLHEYQGTLNHYAGDALYAVWELKTLPQANELAIDFALSANRQVDEIGPDLPLRQEDGSPIQMGWAVVQGQAARTSMVRLSEAIIGDSTNVAFRLSGIAGRDGRAPVMVTDLVHAAVSSQYLWGEPEQVAIKGRHGKQTVYPVLGRR